MPSKLLTRLHRFLDEQIAHDIMALEHTLRVDVLGPAPVQDPAKPGKPRPNINPHWRAGDFGAVMGTVQCVVIHETSGWPSYASAGNFRQLYRSLDSLNWNPPHWQDRSGIGPQYFIEPNGTAFTLIGPEHLVGAPRLTIHHDKNIMNTFALGIENADIGDDGVQPGNGLGPRWWRLSNQAEDLTGMKVYVVLHPGEAPDAVLIWIAQFPHFTGSGEIEDGVHPANNRRVARRFGGWKNMLFSERNYRSLALLCRLLAEQNGLPRNFLLLPYLDNDTDMPNAALFRKLILADQRGDAIALKLGTTIDVIQANGAAFTAFYNARSRPQIWSRFFGADPGNARAADLPCFRGFISHDINGHHPCPGPLFDWHRFAREVWDWWWYPFDFAPAALNSPAVPLPAPQMALSTTHRPYMQARRNTPLLEYYYDANGSAADYNRLHPVFPAIIDNEFLLPTEPAGPPVYAIANGVVVAARLGVNNNPATSGFLLVRHEVFHQLAGNRIDYDIEPTFVWSLISFLSNAGANIPASPPAVAGATLADNPSWLNRFIMRLRECELAVAFHNAANAANPANALSAFLGDPIAPITANALRAALNQGWDHNPSGAGPRLATGQEIERDAVAYRGFANDLIVGRHALFPRESEPAPTPVRVLLGDFLGFSNRMAETAQEGIRIEIFSKERLAVPGAVQRAVSASTEDWWRAASAAVRHESVVEMDLPSDGVVWHYLLTDFLEWVNHITWASEWEKYGVIDVAGAHVAAPPRPITRIVP